MSGALGGSSWAYEPESLTSTTNDHSRSNQSRFSRLFTPTNSSTELDFATRSNGVGPAGERATDLVSVGGWLASSADNGWPQTQTAPAKLSHRLGALGLTGSESSLDGQSPSKPDAYSFLDDPNGDAFLLRERRTAATSLSPAAIDSPSDVPFFSPSQLSTSTSPSSQPWAFDAVVGSPGNSRGMTRVRERSDSSRGEVDSAQDWATWTNRNSSSSSSSPISTRSFVKDGFAHSNDHATPPLLSTPAFGNGSFAGTTDHSLSPGLPRLVATVDPFVPKPAMHHQHSQVIHHPVSPQQQRIGSPVQQLHAHHPPQQQQQQQQMHHQLPPHQFAAMGQPQRTALVPVMVPVLVGGAHPNQQRLPFSPPRAKPEFVPPPPAQVSNGVDGPSVRTWPIVKVENIPFNTTVFDIENWLPPLSLPHVGNVIQPIHIVLHRGTGRTLPHCYLEMVSIEAATNVIALKDRTTLGDRTVRAKWERNGELLRDLFSQEGYFSVPYKSPAAAPLPPAPVKWQLPKTLLVAEDLSQLLFYCANPVHAKERPLERPFLNIVSIIAKFPWSRTDKFTSEQQQSIFDAAYQAIGVAARGSRDDPAYTPLMEKLILIIQACPGFTEDQKTTIRETTFQQFVDSPPPVVTSPARRKALTLPAHVPGAQLANGGPYQPAQVPPQQLGPRPMLQQQINGMAHHQQHPLHHQHLHHPQQQQQQQMARARPVSVDFGPKGLFASSKRQSGRIEFALDGTPTWVVAAETPCTPPPTPPDARDPLANQVGMTPTPLGHPYKSQQQQQLWNGNGSGNGMVGPNGNSRLAMQQGFRASSDGNEWGVQTAPAQQQQVANGIAATRHVWN